MLGSRKMSKFVKLLESDYDMILDSPPLVAVTDATMISKEIDSIILVIKAGQTIKRHSIIQWQIKNIGAPLDGIVMNAVTSKSNYDLIIITTITNIIIIIVPMITVTIHDIFINI